MSKKKHPKSSVKVSKGDKANNDDDFDIPVEVVNQGPAGRGKTWVWLALLAAFVAVAVAVGLGSGLSASTVSQPSAKRATTAAQTPNGAVPEKKASPKLTVKQIKARAGKLPCKDRHDPEDCARMASKGDCDGNGIGWMTVMCAASCNRCELLDPKKRCSEENMGIKLENALAKGDLDKMFRTIQNRTSGGIEVLSTDPWMVLVKDFISEEESSTLLELTKDGLRRSTDQGAFTDDGFQEQVVSDYRTSSNSWCMHHCERHPVVSNLMQRISDLVMIPTKNFESFQVLQYEQTQKYDVHHDASFHEFDMPSGPRVLTFFMYLSDVDEGGETHFPLLNISVKPRKGWALLWPSVMNDFPDSKIDPRTRHAALPVKKGVKHAANSWVHLREYKTPNIWGCTGAFD